MNEDTPPADDRPETRVLPVSARPMFRRTFGKLVGTLRPDLAIDEATDIEAVGAEAESGAAGAGAPTSLVLLAAEALGEALRVRLSARRQKLLRLQTGGVSITETARRLGMIPSKVVSERRAITAIVRGRDGES